MGLPLLSPHNAHCRTHYRWAAVDRHMDHHPVRGSYAAAVVLPFRSRNLTVAVYLIYGRVAHNVAHSEQRERGDLSTYRHSAVAALRSRRGMAYLILLRTAVKYCGRDAIREGCRADVLVVQFIQPRAFPN